MKSSHQATLGVPVSLSGIGVHSGKTVNLHLHPAQAGHGIVFLRTGLPHGRDRLIEASFASVTATELCTVIGEKETGAVATIEHLMAAFSALGVDNVLVETWPMVAMNAAVILINAWHIWKITRERKAEREAAANSTTGS